MVSGYCGMGYNRDAAYEMELQRDLQRRLFRSSKRKTQRQKSVTEDPAKCYDGTTEEEDNTANAAPSKEDTNTTPAKEKVPDSAETVPLQKEVKKHESKAELPRRPRGRPRIKPRKTAKMSTGARKKSTLSLCQGSVDDAIHFNQDEVRIVFIH